MNIILFDDSVIHQSLLPLTYTRPVSEIRVGILTITEKWSQWLGQSGSYLTSDYLSEKFPLQSSDDNLLINGGLCPDEKLILAINTLQPGETLMTDNILLAARSNHTDIEKLQTSTPINYEGEYTLITEPWHIFKQNAQQIEADFKLLTKNRASADIPDPHTIIYGKENLFVEEGAIIRAAIINAEKGPVYIGKNTHIHPGAIINGSFALCEGSQVSMGAKIRGDTTVGPNSKVGGEISNSVIFGHSNKSHDGFLGNSVIGEWCNLGADTNTSNLKNNYADIKIWDYATDGFKNTHETFCGLIMGDHSKSGINTMFNTGTVVGVSSNVFGAGFPRNFIPSFAWGGAGGFTTFRPEKAYEVAEKVMSRRNEVFDKKEKAMLERVYIKSSQHRTWEEN